MSLHDSDRIVIGLDLGGSKTHGIGAGTREASPHRERKAGGANLSAAGPAEVTRQLATVVDELVGHAGRSAVAAVCAGAAGVDTPEQQRRLAGIVTGLLPGARVRIVHDTELILAAAGVEHGIAVIAGTGSVAWGIAPGGRAARAGGWGYLLGDEGSGYWVGRAAVRHALDLDDRGGPVDDLAGRLAAACGVGSAGALLDHFYATPDRRYWAGHSRLVFELAGAGDPAALAIVDAAAAALAGLIRTVAGRIGDTGPIVLGGGLAMHQPLLVAGIRDRLGAAGPADIRVLDRDPVHGAVALARRLLG